MRRYAVTTNRAEESVIKLTGLEKLVLYRIHSSPEGRFNGHIVIRVDTRTIFDLTEGDTIAVESPVAETSNANPLNPGESITLTVEKYL